MKPSRTHLIAALTASLGCASLSAQHVLGYGFGFDAQGREVVVEMDAGAVNAVRSSTVLSGPGV
ncbi:hypothetical protein KQH42_30335, partial [Streptomyces sp. CHA1]|uniref:hypothetical protein n=1 Tax=Streptomyces sp. CHA1 TaxID=2841663 RepID=UPI002095B7D1